MTDTRKLAAILVPDVVGYGRLAGADEDRARLRTFRSDLIDPMIAAHHGRIVKRTGDGSIIEFPTVVDKSIGPIRVEVGEPPRAKSKRSALPKRRSSFVPLAIASRADCNCGRLLVSRRRPSAAQEDQAFGYFANTAKSDVGE